MALLLTYASILSGLCQEKRCLAWIELSSFLRGSVECGISYSFDRHWSINGEVALSYKRIIKVKSELELSHKNEFSQAASPPYDNDVHTERMTFNYWPVEAFKGFSISAGIQNGNNSGIDFTTGVGYMFSIWKDIHGSVALNIPLNASFTEGILHSKNIKIGLYYRF